MFAVEIPQYLYEAGWASGASVIVCTQPRRMAAVSVAHRVATEVGTTIGDEVRISLESSSVSDSFLRLVILSGSKTSATRKGQESFMLPMESCSEKFS